MKEKRTKGVLFIFWLILAILSASWIIFAIYNYLHLIITLSILQFVFILSYISLIISIVAITEILTNGNNKLNKRQQREKNINEIYQYQQLLDPPEADKNN